MLKRNSLQTAPFNILLTNNYGAEITTFIRSLPHHKMGTRQPIDEIHTGRLRGPIPGLTHHVHEVSQLSQ